jgi:hypothetical protein
MVVPFCRRALLVEGDPEESEVPAEFVPGAAMFGSVSRGEPSDPPCGLASPTVPWFCGVLGAFPAPLGSLTALFMPPALAGPAGTPFTPEGPAPIDPAAGVPAEPAAPE